MEMSRAAWTSLTYRSGPFLVSLGKFLPWCQLLAERAVGRCPWDTSHREAALESKVKLRVRLQVVRRVVSGEVTEEVLAGWR